jgi:putative tryptophan/tyrosine transport system substrate-binding protein
MTILRVTRRGFVAALGSAPAWPLVARGQQSMPAVGFLNAASAKDYAYLVNAFHRGLSETGYVEGRNVIIEYRWADGRYDKLPELAAHLVSSKVGVIFANGPAVGAAKAATTTIPIVFASAQDPVASGLVFSLSRPGGNITGATSLLDEIGPKRLSMMHELVPTAKVFAALLNPNNPGAANLSKDLESAAHSLGLEICILHASSEGDFEIAFSTMKQLRVGGLVIGSDPFFNTQLERLVSLVVRHAIPTIYQSREFVLAGGLMSYGAGIAETYQQAGVYVGRILKGERPTDLPVQQVTKVELFINLKAARTLGLTMPQTLLIAADEVIE